ncbi:MAG: hypothetical protein KKF65_05715, partial [Nanoarchaeota archaeon]|nr:hypothetical protein [Nanoarchaeota archaeon]
MDEIHSYSGAKGAEIACLIKRLKSHIDKVEGEITCIGTSATIGSKEESAEEIKKSIINFASDIFSEKFEDDSIIQEHYEEKVVNVKGVIPPTPQITPKDLENYDATNMTHKMRLANLLSSKDFSNKITEIETEFSNNKILDLLELWLSDPHQIEELIPKLKELDERKKETDDIIKLEITAYMLLGSSLILDDSSHRFRPKLHIFYRGPYFFTRTIGADRVLLDGGRDIDKSGKKSHPLALCRYCGQDFIRVFASDYQEYKLLFNMLENFDQEQKEVGPIYLSPFLEKESSEYCIHLTENIHEVAFSETADKRDQRKIKEIHVCEKCGSAYLSKKIDTCKVKGCYGSLTQMTGFIGQAHKCPACKVELNKDVITQLTIGPVAPNTIITTSLLANIKKEEEKKLLIFSDNRQNASFQTQYIKAHQREFALRQIMYNLIISQEQSFNTLVNETLEEANNKRLLTFDELNQYRNRVEKDNLMKKFSFFIMQEFAKSQARRINLEGLGLVKIDYDGIEKIKDDSLFKSLCKNWNLKPEELISLMNNILDIMRSKRAISHEFFKQYLSQESKPVKKFELDVDNNSRKPCGYDFSKDSAEANSKFSLNRPYKVSKFVSDRGINTFQQYLFKVLGSDDRSQINDLLTHIFNLLIDDGLIVKCKIGDLKKNDADAYQVNLDRVIFTKPLKPYKCNSCRTITFWNSKDICPRYRCGGRLVESNINEDDENFYVNFYKNNAPTRVFAEEHSGQISGSKREQRE